MGVQTRKFNLTSKFSSATVANVTEPKGKGLKFFHFLQKTKFFSNPALRNWGRYRKGFSFVCGGNENKVITAKHDLLPILTCYLF